MFRKKVDCRYCNQSVNIRKHGTARSGYQRYYCGLCQRTFQIKYIYNAYYPDTKKQVNELRSQGENIRDTSRLLNIDVNTVSCYLKDNH